MQQTAALDQIDHQHPTRALPDLEAKIEQRLQSELGERERVKWVRPQAFEIGEHLLPLARQKLETRSLQPI